MAHQSRDASEALSPSRGIAFMRRITRPIFLRTGVVGVLVVTHRRTGMRREVTLAPLEVEGAWFLLSQYGDSSWVRDLRAAGRAELRRKGRTQAFTAIEVDGDERDRVIARFHAWTPKPFQRDFERRPGAADHPTFRLESIR